jgi:hypothetical protein
MARIAITTEWAKLFDFETRMPDFLEQLAGHKSDSWILLIYRGYLQWFE